MRTDAAALALGAADLYAAGPAPLAVARPGSSSQVAATLAAATSRGYAVVPRGGGLSYTGGYTCAPDRTVLIDLSGLNRIDEISPSDMFVTAEAGVTWKQLYEALKPHGLRLPFFGTFSGAGATVGGGLSHGALFFGSARYGCAADNALALEVATADGALLRTGQWALQNAAKPILRGFGPDTTGLFLHDGGAFGIKTRMSFRLIHTPAETGFASFAFATLESAGSALSAIARAGIAEDAYVLDPAAVVATAERARGIRDAIRAVGAVARSASGGLGMVRALAGLASGGRSLVPDGAYTLHSVAAGTSAAAVKTDLATARRIAIEHGGVPIAATIPRIARADPFPNLDAVLGSQGKRWAALNAKVAHSEGVALIEAHRRMIGKHRDDLAATGVTITYLLSALGNHSFSFEAVFHWYDAWLPMHRDRVSPALLATYSEPAENGEARALVARLREETVDLFRAFGGASNQIGRTYPFLDALDAAPSELIRTLKDTLDPKGLMNPGVLGL